MATLVPDGISPEELAACEEQLVAKAEQLDPRRLRRAARRILEPLSKRLADEHEGEQLREHEARAEPNAWLMLAENGDGVWTIRGLLELHAVILRRARWTRSPRPGGTRTTGTATRWSTSPCPATAR